MTWWLPWRETEEEGEKTGICVQGAFSLGRKEDPVSVLGSTQAGHGKTGRESPLHSLHDVPRDERPP